MPIDVKSAVTRNITELRKIISERSSEVAALKKELERYESALQVLSQDGRRGRPLKRRRRRRSKAELDAVIRNLPDTFTSREFLRAAGGRRTPSVNLRQTLSRWAKQGKIRRVERGKYQKAKRSGLHRLVA